MTERQWEALELLAGGRTYEEIAGIMQISRDGVRLHLNKVYAALGVSGKGAGVKAVAWWWRVMESRAQRDVGEAKNMDGAAAPLQVSSGRGKLEWMGN